VARITVVSPDAIGEASAERVTTLIEQAIAARDIAFVALTGGTTPRATYEALADPSRPWLQRINWPRVHLYWGDERHVPPDHPDSNFGLADRALVRHVPIPAAQVHRIQGELADPHTAAAEYALELPKAFDVMLLGLGEDCHIASIFPGSEFVVRGGSMLDGHGPATKAGPAVRALLTPQGWRITINPSVILNSDAIVMLVSGGNKATAVAAAINGPTDVARCPGQLLREAADRVEWILDTSAASGLDRVRPG
jgi:6-phosphogluconolactonase